MRLQHLNFKLIFINSSGQFVQLYNNEINDKNLIENKKYKVSVKLPEQNGVLLLTYNKTEKYLDLVIKDFKC